jgi:hypothetical protein
MNVTRAVALPTIKGDGDENVVDGRLHVEQLSQNGVIEVNKSVHADADGKVRNEEMESECLVAKARQVMIESERGKVAIEHT